MRYDDKEDVRAKARTRISSPSLAAVEMSALFFCEIPDGQNEVSPGSEHIESARAKPVRRNIVSVEEFRIWYLQGWSERSERLEGVKQ